MAQYRVVADIDLETFNSLFEMPTTAMATIRNHGQYVDFQFSI